MQNKSILISIISILIIFIWTNSAHLKDTDQEKLSVVIFNFNNTSQGEAYDYLILSIPDIIFTQLYQTGRFSIVSNIEIKNKLEEMGLDNGQVLDDTILISVAYELDADIALIGSFSVVDGIINIKVKAYDSQTSALLLNIEQSSESGGSIFQLINRFAKLVSEKMLTQSSHNE